MTNLLIVTIFALLLLIIGIIARGSAASSQFHMDDRAVSWLRVAFSSFSVAGGGEIVTLVAFTYFFGLWGLALFAGFSLGFWGLAAAAPRFRSLIGDYKIYSVPDFLRSRFGSFAGFVAYVYSAAAVGALLLIQLIVGGLLISTLTGVPSWVGSGLIAITVAGYIVVGGFRSVLVTDVIQSLAMIFAISALLAISLNSSPDYIQNLSQLTAQGIPFGDLTTLLVSGFFAVFGAADIWQRMLSAKSNSDARAGLSAAGIAFLAFGTLVILFGVSVTMEFPNADPNSAFIEVLENKIAGVFGLILTLLVTASVFSTADTELFVLSTITSREFVERDLKTDIPTRVSRFLVVTLLVLTFIVSLVADQLVDIYFFLVLFFMLLGPAVICALTGRGTPMTISVALVLAGAILLYLIMSGTTGGLWPLLSLIPGILPLVVKKEKA